MSTALSVLFVPLALAGPLVTSGQAQETSPVLRTQAATCTVGAYILDLRELDPSRHSFGADLWLWSDCATNLVEPLKATELLNARGVTITQDSTVPRGTRWWSYRKIGATFAYDWDMRNYPFDRHDLEIVAEYTNDIAENFVYTPDHAGTRIDPDAKVEGLSVGTVSLEAPIHTYPTTFGDPLLDKNATSNYSQLHITIPVERHSVTTFLKLTAGVYVAFLVSLLSFRYDPRQTSLMSARSSIVVGALFATLVNLRSTETVLGRSEQITLVDKIHLATLNHLLIAGAVAVASRRLVEQGKPETADKLDGWALTLSLCWYVILNVALIGGALAHAK